MRFLIKLFVVGLMAMFVLRLFGGLERRVIARYSWMIPSRPIL